jgi:hypothetical protein
MKAIIVLILLLGTFISTAQKEIKIWINQPPELSFIISKQDTTIVKGSSVTLGTDLIISGGSSKFNFSWSPASTLNDSALLNPLATPIDTTVYILTVTDQSGCSFSVTYKVNTRDAGVNTDITAFSKKLHAVLFPNPNEGRFRVKLTGSSSERIELTITDISGEIMKRQIIRNFNGDHTEMLHLNLSSGTYVLFIKSGNETLSRQFIIN